MFVFDILTDKMHGELILGLKNFFPETQPTLVFTPDPKNFMDFVLGPKFFWFIPSRPSCPDHLSTKITKHVKVK